MLAGPSGTGPRESRRSLDSGPAPVAQSFLLCGSLPNWPRLCNLGTCSSAVTACLSTLPHGFAFVFPALCRAGCAQVGTDTAHPVRESGTARK